MSPASTVLSEETAEAVAQAAARLRAGDARGAAALCERVLESEPAQSDALRIAASAYAAVGDWQRLEPLLERAARAAPDDAMVQANRGVVLRRLGRLEEAVVAQRHAVALRPDDADSRYNLGNALLDLGRLDEALGQYDAAIALRPGGVTARMNRGLVLQRLGRVQEAIAAWQALLDEGVDSAALRYNLGNALADLRRPAEAMAAYDRAIELEPSHARAFNNRGNARLELGRVDEALRDYDRAIALAPDYADARVNRANALSESGRHDQALAELDAWQATAPPDVHGACARGNVLHGLGRFAEAVESFDRAIAIDPGFGQARLNRALTLLRLGRFAQAWPDYDWRWSTRDVEPLARRLGRPQWRGEASIAGRTILLHAEQGYGDTLQFSRYAAMVADRAGRTILEVPQRLAELMRTLDDRVEVIARGGPLPPFDLHCPLLSLPRAFGTAPATIPASPAYLRVDPGRLRRWERRLGPRRGPRIGLVWQGGTGSRIRGRSLPLAELLRALPPGPQYVSLQHELSAADRALIEGRADVAHFGDEQADFADAAALCVLVDRVVSVDTSVAHLAGALGVPLWILLPRRCDWRWFDGREDTPWYPGARLWRQSRDGDWPEVLARVGTALRAELP